MKKLLFLLTITIFTFSSGFAKNESSNDKLPTLVGKKKIKLSCSQPDAAIFVDDRMVGKGNVEIQVPDEACTIVRIEKEGYITEEIEFCNKKGLQKLENKHHFTLIKDEAFDNTIASDIVNRDFKITAENGKDTSWKLINQIVLNNFDAIEISDKETGYLRTAWVVTRYKHTAVRTRFIVKEFSSIPLVYAVKLASEHSQNGMAGQNDDQHFKEWNRVVKKYSNIESEIDARVK